MNQQRQYFEQIQRQYPSNLVAPSYLRLEQAAGTGSQYTFSVLKDEGTPTSTEKRLDKADAFVVTDFGFYFMSGNNAVNSRLHTFPNTNVFTTTGTNLYAAYNGELSITINQRVIIEAHAMSQHLSAGVAQQAMNIVDDGTNTSAYDASSFNGRSAGRVPSPVKLEFGGNQKIQIELTLPGAIALNGTSNTSLCFMFFGFLVTAGAGRN